MVTGNNNEDSSASNSGSYQLDDMKKANTTFKTEERDNEVEYISTDMDDRLDPSHARQPRKKTSGLRGFIDSFKKADRDDNDAEGVEKINIDDLTTCISPNSPNQINSKERDGLKQTIKPRHVIMISLGTGIGTGLLVGNGAALVRAGPAGLVIGYTIVGTLIYCIIQAAGELAVVYSNLNGGFNAYPTFLVEPGFGFAVSWVYCIQWLTVCPLELVTASLTIKYWTTSINSDIFVAIFFSIIVIINVFGARGYAEAEFFFNCCKILMISGFFILALVIDLGGAGNGGFIGGRYWHTPGAFNGTDAIDHFKGVVSSLVTAAFAYGGTEFVALTAAEQSNPRKAIPSAAKKVLYRIIFVYLVSIIMVGLLVPFDSDQLLGSGDSVTSASPYVLAVSLHGVHVVQHFINAVILISVLSVGNSAFYSSSRLLLSLAKQGYAPKFFDYIDREGRPSRTMLVSLIFGFIAFCAASPKETEVFTWLLAISGLSQLFTWSSICLSHIRFRKAMAVQGRSLGELGFKSQVGVWGSWYSVIMMMLILIGQFWVAIIPVDSTEVSVQSFFENYLAMPIFIAFYFGYKIWKRDWKLLIKAEDIDLISHRQIFDEEILIQEDFEYKEKLSNGPFWHKIVDFWC